MVMFSYGGMDMAQGLGWNIYTGIPDTQQFQFSWFIGVIIGAILAAVSVSHIPKLFFYVSYKDEKPTYLPILRLSHYIVPGNPNSTD